MRLTYFPMNAAYAFTFGESMVDLYGWPMFFETRREAVEAARERGLKVSRRGVVSAIDREARS